MLRVENLKIRGLPPISLELARGEAIAIEGASGSGKSLLLRAIADLDRGAGEIFLDGVERSQMSGPEWRRRVRYVAAESGWWDDKARTQMDAIENVHHWLTPLGLSEVHLDRSIERLSTGERQRLSLIRAISDKPKILLLDEPTSALDQISVDMVEELIRSEIRSGTGVIMVTHNNEQAMRLTARQFNLSSNGLKEA